MTERKYTDEEIIKALECCNDCKCKQCPCYVEEVNGCRETPTEAILDLINRLKAEIERLKGNYDKATDNLKAVLEERADHSEAIKDFAERVKQKILAMVCTPVLLSSADYIKCIDNLVKEMIGEQQ